MVNLNKHHMDELCSKVHDEHQCVTAKSLCIDLGITRHVAAQLLEAVPSYFGQDTEYVYEVTRCVWKKIDGKIVASLQRSNVNASKSKLITNRQGAIYSIALLTPQNGAASLKSGHAYTMTLLHDALLQQDTSPATLCPNLACDRILPAEEVRVLDISEPRRTRIVGMATNEKDKDRLSKPAGGSTRSRNLVASSVISATKPKKITMTAASFFGTSKSKSIETSKFSKTVAKDSKAKAKLNTKSKEKENIKNAEEEEKAAVIRVSKKKERALSNERKEDEDELVEDTLVGNADDFVGEEDEDEDFIKEDELRQQRNAVKARKSQEIEKKRIRERPQRRIPPTEENTINETDENAEGAIDIFTSKSDAGRKGTKRRKKVLEEKTFQDGNGYLRTETISVWKDVCDVEEKKSSHVSGPMRSSNTRSSNMKTNVHKKVGIKKNKNMKQQGLIGFFTAKK